MPFQALRFPAGVRQADKEPPTEMHRLLFAFLMLFLPGTLLFGQGVGELQATENLPIRRAGMEMFVQLRAQALRNEWAPPNLIVESAQNPPIPPPTPVGQTRAMTNSVKDSPFYDVSLLPTHAELYDEVTTGTLPQRTIQQLDNGCFLLQETDAVSRADWPLNANVLVGEAQQLTYQQAFRLLKQEHGFFYSEMEFTEGEEALFCDCNDVIVWSSAEGALTVRELVVRLLVKANECTRNAEGPEGGECFQILCFPDRGQQPMRWSILTIWKNRW